ncbi:hypothetical protein [Actinomadura sp. DC4]|uniref:hypothetical protein n=1 Tax=Actinomadura sp. DC4 TaxID=3055069 RepID=UPI0025AF9A93|nr:hypothetical protein [Actinomadura sp. DC4]MDN3354508.1 hypothetical protein [Actinomadura sp. DC4]
MHEQRPVSLAIGDGAVIGKIAIVGTALGDVVVERADGDETEMNRRQLLRRISSGLGLGVSVASIEAVDSLRTVAEATIERGALSPQVLDSWEHRINEHVHDYATRPARELLQDLIIDFSDLQALLDRCRSPRTGKILVHLLGRAAAVIAVVIDDLGATRTARSWMRTARTAAVEAGDRPHVAWTLAREAFFLLHYGHSGRSALEMSRAATAAARVTWSARVMAPTVAARAHARRGATHEAIAALDEADRAFEHLGAEATQGLFGWSYRQMTFSAGKALTTLGETRRALAAQDRALALFPAEEVLDPALIRLDRAQALIRAGDVTEGCRFGADTLRGLPPAFHSPLIVSWAEEALSVVPRVRRGVEVADFRAALAGVSVG